MADVMATPYTDEIAAWLAADPDDETRAELEALAVDDPDELTRRFSSRLTFGTAGLRGRLGAGPSRMNRVVVRQAAWALGTRLRQEHDNGLVVIGYDSRPKSREFATDTARVLTSLGLRAEVCDGVVPTPVLAFLVLDRHAVAGVMVTASHNPPGDNGYKVYWSDGAQIIPPIDAEIEALIASRGPVTDDELADLDPTMFVHASEPIGRYLDAVVQPGASGGGSAPPPTVYTPLHGVGGTTVLEAYERAGLTVPVVVESQFDPDGSFPTVTLPNPEEDGALDAAFETADAVGASLILANDPDADRLGAAVRHRGEWRVLTGDEIGALLGDHLLEHTEGPDRLVACSVVSSSALDRVARHHGAHARRTLTGFKWIIRPVVDEPELTYVFGYEEALGFAASTHVRDKDGITAAIELSRLAAGLAARGADLVDRLDEMAVRDGLVASQQVSVRYDADPNALHRLMATLRAEPPTNVGDFAVDSCTDWAVSDTPADIFEIDLGPVGRILVRPSGTEPKIKAYLEATMDEIADTDALVEARRTLSDRLDAVAEAVRTLLTD